MSTLPRQIAYLVLAAFLTAQVFLWTSLYSVRKTMNNEASTESEKQIVKRLQTLQHQIAIIASDYHNWTDVFLDAQNLNYESLSSNYGITADRGDIFQYAELFDGPIPHPVGWQSGHGLVPQEGFLSNRTKEALRGLVTSLEVTERQTLDFFEMREGRLVMFSSSYLLPEDPRLLKELNPETQAIATIGKILSEDKLSDIGAEFLMGDLRVQDQKTTRDTVKFPIKDIFGTPVAWLEWYPPTPGTVLFHKMAPIMTFVSLIIAGLFYWGAWLLRDRATKLITKEAASFIQARTDALTGLVNRFGLFERLSDISTTGNLNCALVVMDLDNFKQVNDTIGHVGGDIFLKALGSRLQTLSDEQTFVARLGGDEFVIVISSARPLGNVIKGKCVELNKVMAEHVSYNNMQFECSAAKGGAILNASEFCEKELMRRADVALYKAKGTGNQDIVFYNDIMECGDLEYQLIESNLRLALVSGKGFEVAYQPIVSSNKRNEIICFEALARWRCYELGQVPPDKFIKVAENSGLMISLGWLLLDIICRNIRGTKGCKFSINISPIQLMAPNFAETFTNRVIDNGVQPDQIGIEVTEQVVIRDKIKIFEELTRFRELGFSVALDDFGTGYASIGYLTQMPFDILKIDRSFVRAQSRNAQAQRMVRSMMTLAHSMDLQIVVEGIETCEEAERFCALGADFLQGYYFGRPEPLKDYPPGLWPLSCASN